MLQSFTGYVPARYILAVLGSIGMAIVYGLKVNLSVAMVGMLNHTAIKLESHDNATTNNAEAECQATGGASNAKVSIISFKIN